MHDPVFKVFLDRKLPGGERSLYLGIVIQDTQSGLSKLVYQTSISAYDAEHAELVLHNRFKTYKGRVGDDPTASIKL